MIARLVVFVGLVVLVGCSTSSTPPGPPAPVFPPVLRPPGIPSTWDCEPVHIEGLSEAWVACTRPTDAAAPLDGGPP
jgi:hypothetical protein